MFKKTQWNEYFLAEIEEATSKAGNPMLKLHMVPVRFKDKEKRTSPKGNKYYVFGYVSYLVKKEGGGFVNPYEITDLINSIENAEMTFEEFFNKYLNKPEESFWLKLAEDENGFTRIVDSSKEEVKEMKIEKTVIEKIKEDDDEDLPF